MDKRITVVVLTHNRVHEVSETVASLVALPERPDVIVADNGSRDGTVAELAGRFPEVRVVACGENLGAAGRNRAAAFVATEYVAFSDDDTRWKPGSLARAVEMLDAAPRVAVLSARVVVGPGKQLDETCARMQASPLGRQCCPGPLLVGYMAGACVFRTRLFRDLGGYEPRLFLGGEEALVALDVLDAGYRIAYCDSLVVHQCPSPSRDSRLRRRLLARNTALVAWLRLPWREAAAATARALAVMLREDSVFIDLPPFVARLIWACNVRRLVSRRVLRMRWLVGIAEHALTEVERAVRGELQTAARPAQQPSLGPAPTKAADTGERDE